MTTGGFSGLRVLSLESRRAEEMEKLIALQGGAPTVVPSMREVPLESSPAAVEFATVLLAGGFDIVIFLTGVGTKALARAVGPVCSPGEMVNALRGVTVVARGPKPVAALRDLGVPVHVSVPEPNTWRELLRALDEHIGSESLKDSRIAVQEYGVSNTELIAGLEARGARVSPVPVYRWALPEDTRPLRSAVETLAEGGFDVVLFTTSVQVVHMLRIAEEMKCGEEVLRRMGRMIVGSIGPATSEELVRRGLVPDVVPKHPRMGSLVRETAERSEEILSRKRSSSKDRGRG